MQLPSTLTALLATAALGAAAPPAGAAPGDEPVRVRKDAADLTARERADLVGALLELKRTPSPHDPRLSWYDQFVEWHVELSRCDPGDPLADRGMAGHGGPMFLPWHRHYVLLLENALRAVSGKDVTVPYWDWSSPASTRAVFSEELMGGDGDPGQDHAVTTGPFRKQRWKLNVRNYGLVFGPSATTYITRNIGSFPGAERLPTAADERAALRTPRYDVAPFDDSSDPARSFRNALEGYRNPFGASGCSPDGVGGTIPVGGAELHNAVHLWVGGVLAPSAAGVSRSGTLAANQASPNDPVFFLLHSNVDRLWAQWQAGHGVDTYRPASGYADNSVADVLHPLEEAGGRPTPASVADIRRLGYRYAAPNRRPRTTTRDATLVCLLPGFLS